MHSNKMSIIIALVIIVISIFLLMIYSGKQGKYTFGFVGELYKEIKAEKNGSSDLDGEALGAGQECPVYGRFS